MDDSGGGRRARPGPCVIDSVDARERRRGRRAPAGRRVRQARRRGRSRTATRWSRRSRRRRRATSIQLDVRRHGQLLTIKAKLCHARRDPAPPAGRPAAAGDRAACASTTAATIDLSAAQAPDDDRRLVPDELRRLRSRCSPRSGGGAASARPSAAPIAVVGRDRRRSPPCAAPPKDNLEQLRLAQRALDVPLLAADARHLRAVRDAATSTACTSW